MSAEQQVELNWILMKKPCNAKSAFSCILFYEGIVLWLLPGLSALRLLSVFFTTAIIGLVGGAILWYFCFLGLMCAFNKDSWAQSGQLRSKVTQYLGFRKLGWIIFIAVVCWNNVAPGFWALIQLNGFIHTIMAKIILLVFVALFLLINLAFSCMNTVTLEQASDILSGGDGNGITDPMAKAPAPVGTPQMGGGDFAPQ